MKQKFQFEPVATLAALQLLAASILLLVAFSTGIGTVTLALIGGVIQGAFAVLATFVRGAVVPAAKLEGISDLTVDEVKALLGK